MGADWIQQEQCLEQEWHDVRESIEANVRKDVATGCWMWQSGIDGCGYGQIRVNGHKEHAHRAAYRIFKGDIPPGRSVCHTCDTQACCNPDHLFLDTTKDNDVDRTSNGRVCYIKGTSNSHDHQQQWAHLQEKGMQIRKAVRKKAKLRLGIVAPSGAGKTYSALLISFGLGGKVGMIDTENGSGDLYANLGDYDIINITAPYTVQKYREAIRAFEEAGHSTIIIDSLSHAWAGEGGLLDKQGKIADSGKGSSYSAWRTVTPEHNALVESILQSPCHVIATMRAKQEYVQEKDDRTGKTTIKKVGLAPVQRDGMEYEMSIVLDIDINHVAHATKDRTSLLDGQYFTVTRDTGRQLLNWLEYGEDAATPPPTAACMDENAVADHLAAIDAAATLDDLKAAYVAAFKDAKAANDAYALGQFDNAKEIRKAALSAPATY